MNNINYNLYNKEVIVILKNNKRIIGKFVEDFEEEKEIMIDSTIIKYNEIKEIIKKDND